MSLDILEERHFKTLLLIMYFVLPFMNVIQFVYGGFQCELIDLLRLYQNFLLDSLNEYVYVTAFCLVGLSFSSVLMIVLFVMTDPLLRSIPSIFILPLVLVLLILPR